MEGFGAPSVTYCGTTVRLRWCVGNQGSLQLVSSMSTHGIQQSPLTIAFSFNILGAEAFVNAQFGKGTGPLILDRLGCTGNEAGLLSCYHRGIEVIGSNCTHSDDAGVRCQGRVILLQSASGLQKTLSTHSQRVQRSHLVYGSVLYFDANTLVAELVQASDQNP